MNPFDKFDVKRVRSIYLKPRAPIVKIKCFSTKRDDAEFFTITTENEPSFQSLVEKFIIERPEKEEKMRKLQANLQVMLEKQMNPVPKKGANKGNRRKDGTFMPSDLKLSNESTEMKEVADQIASMKISGDKRRNDEIEDKRRKRKIRKERKMRLKNISKENQPNMKVTTQHVNLEPTNIEIDGSLLSFMGARSDTHGADGTVLRGLKLSGFDEDKPVFCCSMLRNGRKEIVFVDEVSQSQPQLVVEHLKRKLAQMMQLQRFVQSYIRLASGVSN